MKLTDEEEALIKKLRADKITWTPKAVNDYTLQEKAEVFDKLHALALELYNFAKDNGESDDDGDHWAFEAVLDILGKDVWESYNAFLR